MTTHPPASFAIGFLELCRGQEEVVKRIPTVSIERIDLVHEQGILQPVVAKKLSHPRPVLLLHMGTIVRVPRPGPRERDLVLFAELEQRVIYELAAIEFLTVVNVFLGVHDGVGAGDVSERCTTPLLTRSSLLFAMWARDIDRRASRTSAGIL